MNATDLRAVLMLRAIGDDAVAPGGDRPDWAGAEARRRLGEQAPPEAWLAERARLLLDRLGQAQPAWRPLLAWSSAEVGTGWLWLLPAIAAGVGALGEHIGQAGVIHLLAPPLLGLLAWNLVVYGLLGVQALRRRATGAAPGGPLRQTLLRLAAGAGTRLARAGAGLDAPRAAALARFQRDWLALSAPWQSARGAALLHLSAAALALGALASWYARGLVLDYRASWDSTFLDAGQVRVLLGWVLGPAAALTGQPLPDAAALAALRGAAGGSEGAARWIHAWSLTIVGAVVLPRLLLAALAALRARRRVGQLPLPDDEGLRRLLRAAAGLQVAVLVLPYSYQLDAARRAALAQQLDAQWGPGVQLQLQASLPLGAEDHLPQHLPAALPATVVLLFALTATPERETHGALLHALAALRGRQAPPPEVLVDESGFRQRLAGARLDERLVQRRAAWQALLQPEGITPRFVDLGPPTK
ncbi:MAG: DUF2868 domain-containing protein [Burkholderiaceae bacterium]|nr:DUF2868 domain-containing protein [Burkholderiaceae bacterium]